MGEEEREKVYKEINRINMKMRPSTERVNNITSIQPVEISEGRR